MTQKTKNIIGWILTGILAVVFIGSGSVKLIASESTIKGVEAIGLNATTIRLVGVLEILSIVLFIIPRTGLLGTLLLAAYLGGAMVTHLEHQQPVLAPAIIQCIVWITAVIRFPELSRRITGNIAIA